MKFKEIDKVRRDAFAFRHGKLIYFLRDIRSHVPASTFIRNDFQNADNVAVLASVDIVNHVASAVALKRGLDKNAAQLSVVALDESTLVWRDQRS